MLVSNEFDGFENIINSFDRTIGFWFEKRKSPGVVPNSHYFHTHMAYTAFALGKNDIGNTLLEEYFDIKEKIKDSGHLEFNKYASICILESFKALLKASLAKKLSDFIFDNKYSVDFNTTTGNNWLFLRTSIHLKLFLIKGNESDWKDFMFYLEHILQFFDGGLFFDYPSLRNLKYYECKAFPLTYSFKMLSCLVEIYQILTENHIQYEKNEILKSIILEAAEKFLPFIAPDAESLYFGRSDNTLFGYGNIIYLLNSFYFPKNTGFLNKTYDKTIDFITKNYLSEDKNLIHTCTSYKGFRDSYIYDSVYISYFMFKSMQALKIKNKIPVNDYSKKDNYLIRNKAGFIIQKEWENKPFFLFISAEGCVIPDKNTDFQGFRYTGLTPMKYLGQVSTSTEVNRETIKDIYSDFPFCPKFDFGVFFLSPFVFKDVQHSQVSQNIIISGKAEFELLFKNKTVRKLLNAVSRRIPLFLRSAIRSYVKNIFINRLIKLERTIILERTEKNSGKITIKDLSSKEGSYIFPQGWNITRKKDKNNNNITVIENG